LPKRTLEANEATPADEGEFRRRYAYLQAVLGSMPQGISVFDENLRLRVWNQGFLEVLDLPAEAIHDGVHFSSLIRIPAERGEYGPGDPGEHVERITALALRFEAHRFERTRPCGRTHLVHGEPLFIDGRLAGFITTYTDITVRKDAEEALRFQHSRLERLVDNIPSAISLFNAKDELVLHNREFLRLLDLPESMVAGRQPKLEDFYRFNAQRGEYGPGDPEAIVARLMARARPMQAHHIERTRPNGVTLEIRGAPLPDGGWVTTYTDISERRASAERDQLAQKVFNHTPAGIIFTDEANRILSMNPAITEMTGFELVELLGQTVDSLIAPESVEQLHDLQESTAQRSNWTGELGILRKSGSRFAADVRINRVEDALSGVAANHVWILVDITERKQAEERMRHIAQTDALTGLPNRLALIDRLAQLLPEARRHGWNAAIMFLDLDRFKIINDTLGHQIGDELLREVAHRLTRVVRETDFVARLGGDEFVIILPDTHAPTDAALVAGKVIAALAVPIEVDGHELHTTPSIGISVFPSDGDDGDTILKNADTAMYHAKSEGRNNYQFYAADMNRATADRLDLERKLRHAIARNELSLNFQAQFAANGQRPTGVEALLRWEHPEDGLIAPARFIPIAEEAGLIIPIGEWVLFQACETMQGWIEAGLAPLRMAVNVSARQLRSRDFCDVVARALEESGLPPHLLELEITESSVMENTTEAVAILQKLGRMGVTLAIDDFGTGYSSLVHLKLLPIDHLKIDRSFVADIAEDLNDRAIALGTIALAHSLGLSVIAEGVETDDQLELLRSNGCDEVQGYLLAEPMNGATTFAFLHAHDATE
jgi:diguanylate cyclase (GGDEF)-like protein/PAS domain S-box-containing protein